MKNSQYAYIFFGTSQFSAIILEKLIQANMKPILVVTTPDKPVGRKQILSPSPVKVLAQKYELPFLQPEKLDLAELNLAKPSFPHPELFIVAAYGKILPKEILDIPTHGTLNVHPSLLPKYRGPSPIQTAILNGDQETGVTIMLVDEKIDHGPILTKYEISRYARSRAAGQITNDKYTYEELHNILAEIGADLLIKTIPEFVQGKITPIPQNDSKAVYTKILTREDGRIDWTNTAQHIDRQVRAFTPWPGTFTILKLTPSSNGQILKVLKANVLEIDNKLGRKPGQVFLTLDKKIAIQAKENALMVEELQLEGKKPTSAKDFLLGYKDFIGTTLQ